MAARITESEIETAKKMAARASGVTASDLAERLGDGVGLGRARKILERIKAKGKALGGLRKASRTLTYTLK